MVRKLVGLAAGTTLVLGMFLGTDAGSYVRTVVRQARETVKEHVPIGFEIDRAHGMIDSLGGEIRRQMTVIAQEETGVERLAGEVAATKEKLAGEETAIRKLREELATGREVFVFGGREFTLPQVKADLTARFHRFETGAATSKKLGEILAARRQGLEAARNRLAELHNSKRQLEVDVENLEARRKLLEVARAQSQLSFDDSRLGRTRELLEQIGTRIKVAERLVEVEASSTIEIPLHEPDLMDRLAERFDAPPKPTVVPDDATAPAKEPAKSSDAATAQTESPPQGVEALGIDHHGGLNVKPVDHSRELPVWLMERFDRMFERVLNEAFDRPAAPSQPEAKPASTDAASVPAIRRWLDDTGQYETWGQLVSRGPEQVRILKTNGRYTTVPWHRLSDPDRRYVEETPLLVSAN